MTLLSSWQHVAYTWTRDSVSIHVTEQVELNLSLRLRNDMSSNVICEENSPRIHA